MKKINLFAAIYSLIISIFLLIAPLFTLGSVVAEVAESTESGSSTTFDMVIRVMVIVMVLLGILLLVKDRVASTAGKILIVIAGAIVVLFSSFMGFPAGVVGIVGASLLLASNKKYKTQ